MLDTDTREIAIAGAVRISGSRSLAGRGARDVATPKRSSLVLDAHAFGASPTSADLQRVPFEDRSLDLAPAVPATVPAIVDGRDIARFHREVDRRAKPDGGLARRGVA